MYELSVIDEPGDIVSEPDVEIHWLEYPDFDKLGVVIELPYFARIMEESKEKFR